MYYEEKVIGGSIYFRTTPNGKWECKNGASVALKLMRELSEADRKSVMKLFCSYCGKEGRCTCARED